MPRHRPSSAAEMKDACLKVLDRMEGIARKNVVKHGQRVCESAYCQRVRAIQDVRNAVRKL